MAPVTVYSMGMRAILVALILSASLGLAADDKAVEKGKSLFADNCAMCHNADNNEELMGPGLAGLKDGKLPKSGGEANAKTLLKLIDEGQPEAEIQMPPFEEVLSKKEKEALIAYLLTL